MVETEVNTLIVGLGKTGLSCARFLARRGEAVMVADSRREPPGLVALQRELPQVPFVGGAFDAHLFAAAKQLVMSPGVSLQEPAVVGAMAQGVSVTGDIDLFARHARAPVVAITGSNGKSTVTTLVGEMARCAGKTVRIGGNLGTPVLELLQSQEPDLYVIELSSFQLETCHVLNAKAAAILNISPDHLDRYPDVGSYARAKRRIFNGNGTMVINADDPRVNPLCEPGRACVRFTLGVAEQQDFGVREHRGQAYLVKGERRLMPLSRLRLMGRHNVANALAALALGEAAGLAMDPMLDTLGQFPGLPHRTQWVAEYDGVYWCNDSKGTNVAATVAAIAGVPGPQVLIAGGQAKGADFSPLRQALPRKVRAVLLLGEDARHIDQALQQVVPTYLVRDMKEAVVRANALAEPGDTVLLSPACASFDMYSGYVERGQAFCRAVRELLA